MKKRARKWTRTRKKFKSKEKKGSRKLIPLLKSRISVRLNMLTGSKC